jgi:predicted ATP-grasp superfamily ATP-dependent carboligase
MKESSPDTRHGAIVLGGHVQSLGIVRILGRRGIPVIVIDAAARCIARRSRYCRAFYRITNEDLPEFLKGETCRSRYDGWTVFPTNDFHVRILSSNRNELSRYYKVGTDSGEVIDLFYNKINTYRLAERTGIPFPLTFFPGREADLDDPAIPFPCIVKPAVMYDFYRKAGRKVFLCRDREELRAAYEKALKIIPASEVIIQEVIPGDGTTQFSACFLYAGGRSYVRLTACRMRQHPLDFGNATTYAEVSDEPEPAALAERLLAAAAYNGLCEVEFKKDPRDGVFKLLEVNPRTWKWHVIAEKAGTPFIPLWFDHLNGVEIEPIQGYSKASFCHAATDIPVRLALLFRGAGYWNRKVHPVQNAVWSQDDPAPWFFEKIYLPDFIINR